MVKKYRIFNRKVPFATLYEDYTKRPMQMHIQVDKDIPLNQLPKSYPPLMDENYVINHKGVEFWISNRVMPPTQDGVEEKLELLGLSEYSALGLFHLFDGRSNRDHIDIVEIQE